MDEFRLSGDGLEKEMESFVAAMKVVDSDLGAILERQVVLLYGTITDEDRKRARIKFNASVKTELLSLLKRGL